jgi:hypothetical protein
MPQMISPERVCGKQVFPDTCLDPLDVPPQTRQNLSDKSCRIGLACDNMHKEVFRTCS